MPTSGATSKRGLARLLEEQEEAITILSIDSPSMVSVLNLGEFGWFNKLKELSLEYSKLNPYQSAVVGNAIWGGYFPNLQKLDLSRELPDDAKNVPCVEFPPDFRLVAHAMGRGYLPQLVVLSLAYDYVRAGSGKALGQALRVGRCTKLTMIDLEYTITPSDDMASILEGIEKGNLRFLENLYIEGWKFQQKERRRWDGG